MRLFIAIQLSQAIRDELCRVQSEFVERGIRGNYSLRENLHLTLAFIGEYPEPERVLEALDRVSFRPFELRLDGSIGAFSDLWWAGLERSGVLESYVRALRHALAEADIPFDRKRFSPHITLIRRADRRGCDMAGVTIKSTGMTVEHVSLMRSDRGKAGMIYTEIC